jgi:hypothetical protein
MGCVLKITQGNYQVKMDNTVPKNELKVTICVIILTPYKRSLEDIISKCYLSLKMNTDCWIKI